MQITAYKCRWCKRIFEKEFDYNLHVERHEVIEKINISFGKAPELFRNHIQHDKVWFNKFKRKVVSLVKKYHPSLEHKPWTYGWLRTLDGNESFLYEVAKRFYCVCRICYKEHSQSYHAGECCS
jgi:hypothetical protein